MTNFQNQLNAAIKAYSELDGRTEKEILEACQLAPNGQTAENIKLLMFAAK